MSLVCRLALVAVLLASTKAHAENITVEDAREAIETATRKFVSAFNSGDTATMMSLWTKSGDIISGTGQQVFFRDRIVAARNAAADGQAKPQADSSVVMTIDNIRFVTPQVAMVDGTTVYTPAPNVDPIHNRYSAVWVLRENNWRMDSIRENPIAADLHNAHLKELAWMVGSWIDNESDPHLQLQFRWSSDGNYLESQFKSRLPGRGDRSGVQRIGWDAQLGQFRSWTFGHDGGFSQAIWTAFETGWTIENSGVTFAGKPTADQIQITKVNSNTIQWVYENGTIGGQAVPDFRLQLFRKTAK